MGERRFMGWLRAGSGLPARTLDRKAVPPAVLTARGAGNRDKERPGSLGTDAVRRPAGLSPHGIELSAAVYLRGHELRWWMPADRGLRRPAGGSARV
jgi:hypothetical protein